MTRRDDEHKKSTIYCPYQYLTFKFDSINESNRRWIHPSPALSGILSQRERHHSVRFYVSKKYRGFNENCPIMTFK
jgi:hypothetical protein